MKTKVNIFGKLIVPAAIFSLIVLKSFSQTNHSIMNSIAKKDSGYAPVNGLKMYYEIYGKGEPLVLIHGGIGAIEMYSLILPALAHNRMVIAVDLQAHGRTADVDRPLSYELMADDIAALLKYLKIEKADLMGYSLGGEVALQTSIRHPEASAQPSCIRRASVHSSQENPGHPR